MVLIAILLASLAEAAVSFVGALVVILHPAAMKAFAHRVLAFAVGALVAVTFFDILPEAIEGAGMEAAFLAVVGGILLFFALERLLFWYHCHDQECGVHTYVYLVLLGDAVHNFIDGVAIALSFLVSIHLGIATTVAVVVHEVPQEVADFGVLIRGGFSRRRALWANFAVSLTTILGALLAYALGSAIAGALPYVLGVIGGNFLYIALADLLPETHEQAGLRHFAAQFALILTGVLLIYFLTQLVAE